MVRTPLTPENGEPGLNNTLVFVDREGVMWDLSDETLIARGVSTGTVNETTVGWPAHQGVLIRLLPGAAFADVPYKATITWRLEDVP